MPDAPPPLPASGQAAPGPRTASRRELNKAATRQAITDAALGLLRTQGPGNFTVEDIADAAGISRRTFFNYFASTDAAIAAVTYSFLDTALQQFRLRPATEPILESATAALVALADPMTIAPMAELYILGQADPQLNRSELEAWDHCAEQIIEAARERVSAAPAPAAAGEVPAGSSTESSAGPGTGAGMGTEAQDLYLRALAGSVISCGKAAMDVWFARCGGDLSNGSLATLRRLLIEAMSLLGSGFTAPRPAASASLGTPTSTPPGTPPAATPSPDRY